MRVEAGAWTSADDLCRCSWCCNHLPSIDLRLVISSGTVLFPSLFHEVKIGVCRKVESRLRFEGLQEQSWIEKDHAPPTFPDRTGALPLTQ